MKKNFTHKKLLKSASGFIKVIVCISFLLLTSKSWSQTFIAGWDFQTTTNGGTATAASPSTPTLYNANVGAGTIYLNGTNGSSAWLQASELTAFAGTALNAGGSTGLSTVTTGAASLAILGGTSNAANGKSLVFRFSMSNLKDLVVSYATQRTGTGFTPQTWEYSINGTTWVAAGSVTPPAAFAVQTLATITGLDNVTDAYLRLTVTGATSAAGNNRLDNIQLNASPTILPLDITSFTAFKSGNINLISWTTANEVNVRSINVERSANGRNFTQLATLNVGNVTYQYTDVTPLSGVNYYRLNIVDKDGTSKYSKTVAVINNGKGAVVTGIYPTITTGKITLDVAAEGNQKLQLVFTDLQGRTAAVKNVTAASGNNTISIEAAELAGGMYIIKVLQANSQATTFKIIKQ